jgi:sugar transferase (PEP-CTERM/EpsH1 system associated)
MDRAASRLPDARPLVAHVVFRFDVGGLENGVANLINRMAPDAYRHAVISLTEITAFRERITRDDVGFHALNKGRGHGVRLYPSLWRLFRALRPSIVHTRNLAALEAALPAWVAGVPFRVHGEHGWDVADLDGSNRKYRLVRRLYRPFVGRYVTVSRGLESYLVERIGVPSERVSRICNGVDTERFAPARGGREPIDGSPFNDPRLWLVGTVGRIQPVKDQVTLAKAFLRALATMPEAEDRMRLVLVGDGPLRQEIVRILSDAGRSHLAWLPGERANIPRILRGLDCFVLPSLAEGISNTILEAMASGLPVIATRVGGNPELIDEEVTGSLVSAGDPEALARELRRYFGNPALASERGRAGRARAEEQFSLEGMTRRYRALYDGLLGVGSARAAPGTDVARAR